MSTFQICEKWAKSFKISVIFEKIFDFRVIFRAHFRFLGLCSEFCGAHFDFSVKYEAMSGAG